jgi:hypothetical protein
VEALGPDQAQFTIRAPIVRDDIEGNHGVSLALSRRLVELHGGRLRVEQHEGSTLFEFILPLGELTADSIASNRGRQASETQDQRASASLEARSESESIDEKSAL